MKTNCIINFTNNFSNMLCSFIPPGSQSVRNLHNILSVDANCSNRSLLEGRARR